MNYEAIETAAAAWLARQDNTGTWTKDDQRALSEWLAQNTAHRVAWLRLRQAWVRADAMADMPNTHETEEIEIPRLPLSVAPPKRSRRLAYFAGVTMMTIAAVAAYLGTAGRLATQGVEQYATAVGARRQLNLADGSHVLLNTRTRARAEVSRSDRQFWLDDGEAFFEIAHDPAHPFVIRAGNDRITVLGTKFSVRHENGRTQVTVLEGKVRLDHLGTQVAKPAPEETTTLVKNDTAVSQKGDVVVATRTPQQTLQDLSWRSGRIQFDNRPLVDIAAEFNRYNRRQIVVHEDAAQLRLSVDFDSSNVDGFTRLIHTGFGVVVHANGDQIDLSMS
ncbi:MAG TPA: FecR domain-containing protein [Burkholderiaceae bacterium]